MLRKRKSNFDTSQNLIKTKFLYFNYINIIYFMSKLPIYNVTLGDLDGITTMSLVDFPAVESDFIAFAEDKQKMLFSLEDDQHIIFGCALRADHPIYRIGKNKEEFYVVFSKDVINQLYEKFMIDGVQNLVDLQHNNNDYTDDVKLICSFIKDTEKGLNPVGFEDIADGSWFVAYKVLNADLWKRIKSGEFNGFSVEAIIGLETQKHSSESIDDLIKNILK